MIRRRLRVGWVLACLTIVCASPFLFYVVYLNRSRSWLHSAVARGDISAVRQLLGSKGDINVRRYRGKTGLHIAAEMGRPRIAELLVARGAQVDARDDAGKTPLHYAALSQDIGVARILVAAGGSIRAQDDQGYMPTDYGDAAFWRNVELTSERVASDTNTTETSEAAKPRMLCETNASAVQDK